MLSQIICILPQVMSQFREISLASGRMCYEWQRGFDGL